MTSQRRTDSRTGFNWFELTDRYRLSVGLAWFASAGQLKPCCGCRYSGAIKKVLVERLAVAVNSFPRAQLQVESACSQRIGRLSPGAQGKRQRADFAMVGRLDEERL